MLRLRHISHCSLAYLCIKIETEFSYLVKGSVFCPLEGLNNFALFLPLVIGIPPASLCPAVEFSTSDISFITLSVDSAVPAFILRAHVVRVCVYFIAPFRCNCVHT